MIWWRGWSSNDLERRLKSSSLIIIFSGIVLWFFEISNQVFVVVFIEENSFISFSIFNSSWRVHCSQVNFMQCNLLNGLLFWENCFWTTLHKRTITKQQEEVDTTQKGVWKCLTPIEWKKNKWPLFQPPLTFMTITGQWIAVSTLNVV